MVRTIGSDKRHVDNPNSLARMEDVDIERLKKKYMENVKKGNLPNDERTITEIQMSEDTAMITDYADFFELEGVSIDPLMDNPLETMQQITAMMEEGAKELDIIIEQQKENAIEENAAEGIEQIKEFTVNDTDPLLATDFKEKSERIIQKWIAEEKKKTESSASSVFEEARQESRSSYSDDSYWGTSGTGTRTATATSTTSTSSTSTAATTTTVQNNVQREKEIQVMYSQGAEKMRAFVYNGPVKPKKKKDPNARLYGKRKFSIKSVWSSAKEWLRSEEASTLCKVGIAVCLETALAVITKQRSFDNGGQLLGYIGMMLGVFYIGSEIRSLGYDQRRLALI